MTNTGALIVATPLEGDPIFSYASEEPHVTMLWFGEVQALPPDLVTEVGMAVTDVAGQFMPFQAAVAGQAILGPDKASVLLLESEELVEMRALLALNDAVEAAWTMADKQFPWWVCHLTTGYSGELPVDPPEAVSIGSLDLWLGDVREAHPLTDENATMASVMVPPVLCLDDLAPAVRYADRHPAARWYAQRRAVALGAQDLIPAGWSA